MGEESLTGPLRAIICGYEKSGTTLLNEILRRHPRMDSGFECGFLLGDSPRDFPGIMPYFAFFRRAWQLTPEDMRYLCDTDNWGECYRRARERSPVIVDKTTDLFDKTPIYMLHLSSVLARAPGIPCIVSVRDPRALMLSWARWSGHTEDAQAWIYEHLDEYCSRYIDYGNGYRQALAVFGNRVMLSQFETLCLDPQGQVRRIFDFIGLEFRPEYLNFSSEFFVYGNTVSADYIQPYRGVIADTLCQEILERTAAYSQWHFSLP